MPESIPSHWYNGEYHIPREAPIPSKANYSPENVACLIEMFAGILGVGIHEVRFRYPNNTEDPYTEDIPEDDIFVEHPAGDHNYSEDVQKTNRFKSPELLRYERAAKGSAILKLYESNSPANIKYFQT
jgi:hypothetical protein